MKVITIFVYTKTKIMNFDKIFLALNKECRSAILSIIGCSLVAYIDLFTLIDSFKSYEWYQQLIIAIGASICFVMTFTPLYFTHSAKIIFYYPFFQLCVTTFSFVVLATLYGDFGLFGFACCFVACAVAGVLTDYLTNRAKP